MSKFIMNERSNLINDNIEGIIASSRWKNLVQLDINPFIRVVIRKEWNKERVALISGGGSGHEPSHIGFIGKGMLTAAVCGDIFSSPSVESIFSAIIAVTGKFGCLLIVKNYTGDRLNFGLAAEKAKSLGYLVELIIVGDDISLSENKQPRGISGTILIHKIAGYAAEQGYSLNDVKDMALSAIQSTISIGISMEKCCFPFNKITDKKNINEQIELGIGIHGESGVEILSTINSREIITIMIERLSAHLPITGEIAILINNLGGMSPLEMNLITKEIINSILINRLKYIIGPSSMMSSLDTKGFSLSIIVLNDVFETALLSKEETANWSSVILLEKIQKLKLNNMPHKFIASPSENKVVDIIINSITSSLKKLEKELNLLDSIVGDGDIGTTLALGANEIAEQNRKKMLPQNNLSSLFLMIGDQLSTIMGGSIGALISIFFTTAGQKKKKKTR